MKVIFNTLLTNKLLKKRIEKQVEQTANEVFQEVKRRSPVRGGKFKRSWNKTGRGTERTVTNPQPYGLALERGRSRQAPRGVVAPTLRKYR
jgi:hypothetical protein|tara:strand:- start:939 stop:1211 length:273 start_codon:yes stop_codon:yes gene_type:complete